VSGAPRGRVRGAYDPVILGVGDLLNPVARPVVESDEWGQADQREGRGGVAEKDEDRPPQPPGAGWEVRSPAAADDEPVPEQGEGSHRDDVWQAVAPRVAPSDTGAPQGGCDDRDDQESGGVWRPDERPDHAAHQPLAARRGQQRQRRQRRRGLEDPLADPVRGRRTEPLRRKAVDGLPRAKDAPRTQRLLEPCLPAVPDMRADVPPHLQEQLTERHGVHPFTQKRSCGRRSAGTQGSGTASPLLTIALFGGLALATAPACTTAARAPAPCTAYLGVTMAHFVIDAGIWRLRDEFPRQFLTSRLPYLLGRP
jgi:hypothetical protein